MKGVGGEEVPDAESSLFIYIEDARKRGRKIGEGERSTKSNVMRFKPVDIPSTFCTPNYIHTYHHINHRRYSPRSSSLTSRNLTQFSGTR